MRTIHPIKSGFLVFLLLLTTSTVCYGMDTDLYVLSGVNIPPNVLIILDSSASMDEVSSGQIYDSTIDYTAYNPSTVYPGNAVYTKSGSKWVLWANDVNTISCEDLRNNYLIPYGEAINYSNSVLGCGISKKDFQTGNFMNFLQLNGGPGGSRPRFGLANGIIHSYINTTGGVRFAVMAFNNDTAGKVVKYNSGSKQEYVDVTNGDEDAKGGRLLGFVDENKNGKTALFSNLASLKNETWSPLAESLYEAGVYFQKGTSTITGTSYASSPVQYYCQKNYVLIISDGDPTKDTGNLVEVARTLFNLDLSNESSTDQNIRTYTIGFSLTHKPLEDTAKAGGGKYFYVWSSQSFNIAFQTFIAEVLKESTSYVAPVVPISQMESFKSGNQMYLAMFKPTPNSFWKGNIKKYTIATEKSSDCNNNPVNVGDVLDFNGCLVMDSTNNNIKISAKSYWSSMADGEDVEKGGVGELLKNRSDPRIIHTYLGTNTDLIDSSNAFSLSNGAITPTLLGLSSGDTT